MAAASIAALALAAGPARAAPDPAPLRSLEWGAARVEKTVAWLVEDIGPRPFGSAREQAAADGVRERLVAAGWSVESVGRPANQIACRGAPRRVFLAHIDTVSASPGAVDNAAAVALLLEMARTTEATDLCLAFPDGEEDGLLGSRLMAEEGPLDPEVLELAVAMDLTGQGELAIMGLGPTWGDAQLSWLAQTLDPLPQIPFPYRVYSRLLPDGERSDHAPFSVRGVPALLLFGQGEGEVFPRYHQPEDTNVERPALIATGRALEQLAGAPSGPRRAAYSGSGLLLFGWLFPTWATWATLIAGWVSGAVAAAQRPARIPVTLLQFFVGIAVVAVVGGAMTALASTDLWAPAVAELTAADVMGMPATGWWSAAPWASLLGLGVVLLLRDPWVRWARDRASAPLAAAITAGVLAPFAPLVALPFGAAAVASRLHPLVAILPALILTRPDALRQLAFHGLVAPMAWGALWLLAWPALGGRPKGRKRRLGQSAAPISP